MADTHHFPRGDLARPALCPLRARTHAAAHGDLTAATFRNLIGASRKFSIALLSYLDRTGFTLRVGDVRKLRR